MTVKKIEKMHKQKSSLNKIGFRYRILFSIIQKNRELLYAFLHINNIKFWAGNGFNGKEIVNYSKKMYRIDL